MVQNNFRYRIYDGSLYFGDGTPSHKLQKFVGALSANAGSYTVSWCILVHLQNNICRTMVPINKW